MSRVKRNNKRVIGMITINKEKRLIREIQAKSNKIKMNKTKMIDLLRAYQVKISRIWKVLNKMEKWNKSLIQINQQMSQNLQRIMKCNKNMIIAITISTISRMKESNLNNNKRRKIKITKFIELEKLTFRLMEDKT